MHYDPLGLFLCVKITHNSLPLLVFTGRVPPSPRYPINSTDINPIYPKDLLHLETDQHATSSIALTCRCPLRINTTFGFRYLSIALAWPSGPNDRQINLFTYSAQRSNALLIPIHLQYSSSHFDGLKRHYTPQGRPKIHRPVFPTLSMLSSYLYKPERGHLISISLGNFPQPKTTQTPYSPVLDAIMAYSSYLYNGKRTFLMSAYSGSLQYLKTAPKYICSS